MLSLRLDETTLLSELLSGAPPRIPNASCFNTEEVSQPLCHHDESTVSE